MKCYIGIDPGKKGGIAWILGQRIFYEPMPETETDLKTLFSNELSGLDAFAFIEKVHAMPEQGRSSIWTFAEGFGGLRMCLVWAGIPFETVTPMTWQKSLRIPKKGKNESKNQHKEKLRAKAQELYPKLKIWSKPKTKGKQLAICDSLLIATYCKRNFEGWK